MINNTKFDLNKFKLNSIFLFLKTFSIFLKKIKILNYVGNGYSTLDYHFLISKNNLNFVIKILKSSLLFNYNYLIDILGVDNLNFIVNNFRFSLNYVLVSSKSLSRLILEVNLCKNEEINSLNEFYSSSLWAEREIYDLFGIIFNQHKDLRRILTDYDLLVFLLEKISL